jgi:hypothetical protein
MEETIVVWQQNCAWIKNGIIDVRIKDYIKQVQKKHYFI